VTVKATRQNENISIAWKAAGGNDIVQYEVERSTDATHFNMIGTRSATIDHNTESEYQFLDVHPVNGENFYRIKYSDANGLWKYTAVVSVSISGKAIKVFPNPVKDNVVNCYFENYTKGEYELTLLNRAGQVVTKY